MNNIFNENYLRVPPTSVKVKVKKLDPNAKLPVKAHEKDFCYDVVAVSRKRVGWRTWEYKLGLAFEIERNPFLANLANVSLDFRPRSSVYKTGLSLCNCCGTIDELYRGEVKAYFYRVNLFGKKYKVGDRIGQIKLGITLPLEFEEVDELNMNTERGTGGFGSTGKEFFILNNKKEA